MVSRNICVVFGLLLCCVTAVYSIKCFQCNSAVDPGCAELSVKDTNSSYLKECQEEVNGMPSFCRRSVYTIIENNKLVRVSLECGYLLNKVNQTRCYKMDTDHKYEVNCQCFTDACNSATVQFSTTATLILLISTLIGIKMAC